MKPDVPRVVHDTVVVERRYPFPLATVYAAYADVEQRRKWFFPGERDGWVLAEMTQDFRGRRRRARPLRTARRSVELERGALPRHRRERPRRLTITDQSAFFDGREAPQDRRSGWGQITARLEAYLQASIQTRQET